MEGERKLEGKVAVVTGAGSSGPGFGTGKAISVLFAREGAKLVLVDRFEDRAKETQTRVEAEGADATIVTVDLAEVSSAGRVVDEAVATFGGVDILVNNAAVPSSTGIPPRALPGARPDRRPRGRRVVPRDVPAERRDPADHLVSRKLRH